jgi:hypothetical protein
MERNTDNEPMVKHRGAVDNTENIGQMYGKSGQKKIYSLSNK